MGNINIPEDLLYNVRVFKIEETMQQLEKVFAPQVTFSEDMERMRKEAEDYRLRQVRLAMRTLYLEVPGLISRPELGNDPQ